MRLTLFSRLILGYLAVFALVIAVSLYTLQQLQRFDDITQSILERDNRILDYEKKLADSFLSQVRYERKYVIAKDQTLYREFLKFKGDFERDLSEASELADPKLAELLNEVRQGYAQYQELFDKEIAQIRAHRDYPQGWYNREKSQITDKVLALLEQLRVERQQGTYRKVRELADAGARARDAALTITIASLLFILILSLLMARSITRPIAILKNKTREIAGGRFEADLRLSSPPEMAELAASFNLMCRKLSEIDKMKSDFFASMSHELRTPLTSIKEGTGLLLEGVGGVTTEKQRKLLTILAEESNRLIGLVNSLLDLSKMEAGMMNYSFEKASLTPLIKKAVSEITPLIEAKGIQLEAEVPATLPAVKVDPERILQALRNLIGNAVKFTPRAGRIKVAARPITGKVEVSVRDTGPGIAAENLKTIFDKFHQGNSGGTFSANGSGLGLAIAKHIIVSHGGEIWAENHPDQGSTFKFVLPC
ncbi:MAG TPA: ATP-binding protein [Candidatus Binatia bacterium]|jgi:two-component system sensor histidine kinase GlrK